MRKSYGYSGDTTIEFVLERFKDKETGALYTEGQIAQSPDNEEFEFNIVYIDLIIKGSAYYHMGNFSGHPDTWEPDDRGCELESVLDKDGNDWEPKLTKSESNEIMEKIIKAVIYGRHDDDYDDWCGY